jgi:hypothetical protein
MPPPCLQRDEVPSVALCRDDTPKSACAGGERSFTTVCFALALGEYTQSPFRAMDEFDVFMDAVNRRISLVSLFENALLHPDIQFLLLTPQVCHLTSGQNTNMVPITASLHVSELCSTNTNTELGTMVHAILLKNLTGSLDLTPCFPLL